MTAETHDLDNASRKRTNERLETRSDQATVIINVVPTRVWEVMDERTPDTVKARIIQDGARQKIMNGELEEAMELLLKAGELDPKNPYVFDDIALVHIRTWNAAEAFKYFDMALEIDPNNANSLCNAGWLAAQIEQYDLAADYLKRAVEAAPTDPYVHLNLWNVYDATEQMKKAFDCLNEALRYGSGDSNIVFAVWVVCLNRGLREDAVRLFEKAVVLDPKNPEYPKYLKLARTKAS